MHEFFMFKINLSSLKMSANFGKGCGGIAQDQKILLLNLLFITY